MGNTFKVGDKITYVKEGALGWEVVDWGKMAGCELGEVYTVFECKECSLQIVEDHPLFRYNINTKHFKLITDK